MRRKLLLCILALLMALQLMGAAAGGQASCSLLVHLVSSDGTEEYEGVKVCLIPVADMSGTALVYNSDFSSFNKAIPSDIDEIYIDALAEYASQKNISGKILTTDSSGNALYENLDPGMYLIVQIDQENAKALFSPFLSILPSEDGNDVIAEPKMTLVEQPTPTPTTTVTPTPTPSEEPKTSTGGDNKQPPEEPKLVQTGIEQRPVPVLLLAGLLLLTAGVIIRIGDSKHNEG